ncbi:ABC transporter substrate-binding protein [Desulfoscipio sp. XC116]|uniref:ABC transporter substrate-binding protein n=1 Tax=Desulfoscipio sp. XC116 TaxID=3144975 RepID=UPI00325B4962
MFKQRNILALAIVLIILTGGGIFYMFSVYNKNGKDVVTLRIWENERTMLHLPLYAAIKEGYFTEQGIMVQLVNHSGTTAKNPYADDLADIILTDPVDCLYHKSVNPAAPQIIAALAHRDGTFILAREKETFSWAGLKDKNTICYPPETGPGLVMEKIIRDAGMIPMRDLCLYNRIPGELRLGVFKSGSGSYVQLTGAEAIIAEETGAGFIVARPGEAVVFPSVLCAVKTKTLNTHADAIQSFVNGIYKAQLWMQHEPGIAAGTAEVYLDDLDKKTRGKILREYSTMKMWPPLPQIEEKTFNDIKQLMETTGQLAMPVTFASSVDNSFARRAADTIKYIPKEEREKSWFRKIID